MNLHDVIALDDKEWATGLADPVPPDEYVVALINRRVIVALARREMCAVGWTINCSSDIELDKLAALLARAADISGAAPLRPIVKPRSRRSGHPAKPRKRLE